ncbi:diguanylate cyclase [Chlorobaculum limnaeum]|uniref:diguanylate cyclase n=1 Tax=Chlorobaculum limnaeum TaxID=274537 RepID=A0A1D8CXI6_CHLLM|nr:GGDEF domain-containing protein [Chlorobaculum limnaeum]AOS83646.1 diguanylate cyclase [Chlorobaculum limnaeum]
MKHGSNTSGKGFIRLTVLFGFMALLLVAGGTAWFGAFQSSRLREIASDQALRMRLVECRARISSIEQQFGDGTLSAGRQMELQSKLRIECARFSEIGRSAEVQPESVLGQWLKHRKPLVAPVSRESLQLMIVDLDGMIEQMNARIAADNDSLAASLNWYLAFITILLIIVVLAAGRLIVSNYRHSIIPLHQLSQRLTLLNCNLPESLHDTAEAAETLLSGEEPSAEMRSVSESVVSMCHDIEEKNRKLDELHIRDEKTNLYNYRHFKEHLIIDVERARRLKGDIALAMIDIDHFKRYNDRYGHVAGDRVLARIAEIIREECRMTDIPSRFGGDEFAVLFPKTDRATALEISERLRSIICDEPFEYESNQPGGQLTVSIGVASWLDDATDGTSLITNADKALYKAKHLGRNMVLAFSKPLEVEEEEGS